MMSKWWCLFIGCIAWSGAYAVTLEEQYSGLHNCRFENVYYDQQLKQFGPEAYFFKENNAKLSVCWESEGITSFCINGKIKFYGLNVKELTLSGKNSDYLGIVFLNDEETVRRVLSKHYTLDVADNENSLPSVDVLPEDGFARVYCNLYNVKEDE